MGRLNWRLGGGRPYPAQCLQPGHRGAGRGSRSGSSSGTATVTGSGTGSGSGSGSGQQGLALLPFLLGNGTHHGFGLAGQHARVALGRRC